MVVAGGNRRARDYAGQTVSFDLSAARIKVDDGTATASKTSPTWSPAKGQGPGPARLRRLFGPALPARKLQVKYPEPEDETETEPAPEAPPAS